MKSTLIIAAESGWRVLIDTSEDGLGPSFYVGESVIAWSFDSDLPMPITSLGIEKNPFGFIAPDGRIETGEIFNSLKEAQEYYKKERIKDKEERRRVSTSSTEKYLTRTEASEYLTKKGIKVAKTTLQKWVTTGGGPKYVRIGRNCLYLGKELDAWIERKMTTARTS